MPFLSSKAITSLSETATEQATQIQEIHTHARTHALSLIIACQ